MRPCKRFLSNPGPSGSAKPYEPNQTSGKVGVAVTIPEVFTGISIYELSSQEGKIVKSPGMETPGETVSINAGRPDN